MLSFLFAVESPLWAEQVGSNWKCVFGNRNIYYSPHEIITKQWVNKFSYIESTISLLLFLPAYPSIILSHMYFYIRFMWFLYELGATMSGLDVCDIFLIFTLTDCAVLKPFKSLTFNNNEGWNRIMSIMYTDSVISAT